MHRLLAFLLLLLLVVGAHAQSVHSKPPGQHNVVAQVVANGRAPFGTTVPSGRPYITQMVSIPFGADTYDVSFCFDNRYLWIGNDGNDVILPGSMPLQIQVIGLENPALTQTVQLSFPDGPSHTMQPGDYAACTNYMPAQAFGIPFFARDTVYWLRLRAFMTDIADFPTGVIPIGYLADDPGAISYKNTTATDQNNVLGTGPMTLPSGAFSITTAEPHTYGIGPSVVLGHPLHPNVRPAICILGDSWMSGTHDNVPAWPGTADGVSGRAMLGPSGAIKNVMASAQLVKGGTNADGFANLIPSAFWFFPYCNAAFIDLGRNDLPKATGETAIDANNAQHILWGLAQGYGQRVLGGMLVPPSVKSTDSFATLANMTSILPTGIGSPAEQLNALLMADLAAGRIDGMFLTSAARANPNDNTDPNYWKWPVNGTANWATSEGLHPIGTGMNSYAALATELRQMLMLTWFGGSPVGIDGLVAAWRPDTGVTTSGTNVSSVATAYGAPGGVLNGTVPWTLLVGQGPQGLSMFSFAAGQYGTMAPLTFTTQFTVTAVLTYNASGSANQHYVGHSTNANDYLAQNQSAGLLFRNITAGGNFTAAMTYPTSGGNVVKLGLMPQVVTAVIDLVAHTGQVFLDGVPGPVISDPGFIGPVTFDQIGAATNGFNGYMGPIEFFNRALSPNEIASNANFLSRNWAPRTIYVTAAGSDTSRTPWLASGANPLQTLPVAVSYAIAGQTIAPKCNEVFRIDGSYAARLLPTHSGTAAAPIVLDGKAWCPGGVGLDPLPDGTFGASIRGSIAPTPTLVSGTIYDMGDVGSDASGWLNTATTVAAAGTGYANNDTITMAGCTNPNPAPQATVTTDGAGHVTGVHVNVLGQCDVYPNNPVSFTGGTGTGLTVNAEFGCGGGTHKYCFPASMCFHQVSTGAATNNSCGYIYYKSGIPVTFANDPTIPGPDLSVGLGWTPSNNLASKGCPWCKTNVTRLVRDYNDAPNAPTVGKYGYNETTRHAYVNVGAVVNAGDVEIPVAYDPTAGLQIFPSAGVLATNYFTLKNAFIGFTAFGGWDCNASINCDQQNFTTAFTQADGVDGHSLPLMHTNGHLSAWNGRWPKGVTLPSGVALPNTGFGNAYSLHDGSTAYTSGLISIYNDQDAFGHAGGVIWTMDKSYAVDQQPVFLNNNDCAVPASCPGNSLVTNSVFVTPAILKNPDFPIPSQFTNGLETHAINGVVTANNNTFISLLNNTAGTCMLTSAATAVLNAQGNVCVGFLNGITQYAGSTLVASNNTVIGPGVSGNGVAWSTLGVVADGTTDNTAALNALPTGSPILGDCPVGQTIRFNGQWLWQSNLNLTIQSGCQLVSYAKLASSLGVISQADLSTPLVNVSINGLNIYHPDLTYTGRMFSIYINHFKLLNWTVQNYNGMMFVQGSDQEIAFGRASNGVQATGNPGIRHLGNFPKVATSTGMPANVWIHNNSVASGDGVFQVSGTDAGLTPNINADDILYENNVGTGYASPLILIGTGTVTRTGPGFSSSITNVRFNNITGTCNGGCILLNNANNTQSISGVTISNVTADASNGNNTTGEIRVLDNSQNVSFSNVKLVNPFSRSIEVSGNNISNITFDKSTFPAPVGNAPGPNLYIRNSTGLVVSNSTIGAQALGRAVQLGPPSFPVQSPVFINNTIGPLPGPTVDGILLQNTDSATVSGNTISGVSGSDALQLTTAAFPNPGTTNSILTNNKVATGQDVLCVPVAQGNVVKSNPVAADCPNPNILWFSPSNGGQAAGTLPDFASLFTMPNTQWPTAQSYTKHLNLLLNMLNDQGGPWISANLTPFIAATGIKLDATSGIATGRQCNSLPIQNAGLANDISTLKLMPQVSTLFMESTVSRDAGLCCLYIVGTYNDPKTCPAAPITVTAASALTRRVQDMIWYMNAITAALGPATPKFGIVDSTLAKGNTWIANNLGQTNTQGVYTYVLAQLAAANLTLSVFQQDQAYENYIDLAGAGCASATPVCLTTVAATATLQSWLISQGLQPVIELTSVNPLSEADFNTKVLATVQALLAGKVPGNDFMYIGFKTFPLTELPETGAYPETRNLKDIGAYLTHTVPISWSTLGVVADGVTDNSVALNALPTSVILRGDCPAGGTILFTQWLLQSNMTVYMNSGCPMQATGQSQNYPDGYGALTQTDLTTPIQNILIDGLTLSRIAIPPAQASGAGCTGPNPQYCGSLVYLNANHFTLTHFAFDTYNSGMFIAGSDIEIGYGMGTNAAAGSQANGFIRFHAENPGVTSTGSKPINPLTGTPALVWIHDLGTPSQPVQSGDATLQISPNNHGFGVGSTDNIIFENSYTRAFTAPCILLGTGGRVLALPFLANWTNFVFRNISGTCDKAVLTMASANNSNMGFANGLLQNLTFDNGNDTVANNAIILNTPVSVSPCSPGPTCCNGYFCLGTIDQISMQNVTVNNANSRSLFIAGPGVSRVSVNEFTANKPRIATRPSVQVSNVGANAVIGLNNLSIVANTVGITLDPRTAGSKVSLTNSTITNIGSTKNCLTLNDIDSGTITGNTCAPASGVVVARGLVLTHFVISTVSTASCPGGYVAGDLLTVLGGGVGDDPGIVSVDEVDGSGCPTAMSLSYSGSYATFPSSPASVTGGSGSGITLNLTSKFGTTNTTVTGNNVAAMPSLNNVVCASGQGNTVTGNTGASNCPP